MAVAEAPELSDDAVEEILVRCAPDDPAVLFRAALVCKRWNRLVTDPDFRRRYVERHRAAAAPALGFVCNLATVYTEDAAHFVPAAASSSPFLPSAHRWARALLLGSPKKVATEMRLAVWDPVTGERRVLPAPPVAVRPSCWNAAVLCATDGCDHLDEDCHRGPFSVVVVGVHPDQTYMYSCVYSSSAEPRVGGGGVWRTRRASSPYPAGCSFKLKPSALARNALHFFSTSRATAAMGILKYDLETKEMSVIHLPCTGICPRFVLATMEDGGLITGKQSMLKSSGTDYT